MSYSRRQLYAMGETFGDSATRMEAGGRIVYGGGGGNSAPAPQPSTRITESGPTVTNRTTANEIPKYLTDASQDLIARGQALTSRPYEAYTGARVAEFSPDMQTAFGRMRNQQVAPQIGEATGLASLAGKRAMDYGMFGEGVQQYMNPYMQNVVDIERRKAQEAADQQAAALSGQAVRQGAFGGSGAALQQRALRRDTAQQLGDIQAQGLNRAYESAVNQYNQGISSGLAAAGQLGGLGQQQFGQEMDITKGLGTSGDVQRQREQALLDVGYGDYLTAQKYPYEQLAFQQGLISGVPYSTTQRTSEISRPGKTVSQLVEPTVQPNPASQLIGAGVTAYGASGNAKGGEIKRYAAGGIAGLNQPEMASALQGMSDPEVQGTAAVPGLPGLTAQAEQERRDKLRMAAEGQQAPASMTKITSVLSQMSDAELQQYAKLNKSDPYTMALVVAEADRRKNGGMPNQGQPKVVDQKIASMALPEDLGIAQLPVGNMEFAGGGIIAFANGGDIEALLQSAAEKQARGLPLTPMETKAVQEAMASQEAAPVAVPATTGKFIPASSAANRTAINKSEQGINQLVENRAQAAAVEQAKAEALARPPGIPSGLGYLNQLKTESDRQIAAQAAIDERRAADVATARGELSEEEKLAREFGAEREKRLKAQEEKLAGSEKDNFNTTLIEAGLAMMAGQSPNALLNIAQGAQQGLKGYQGRLQSIQESRDKLDESMARLAEIREEKLSAVGLRKRELNSMERSIMTESKAAQEKIASAFAGDEIKFTKDQADRASDRAFKIWTIQQRGDQDSLALQRMNLSALNSRRILLQGQLTQASRDGLDDEVARLRGELAGVDRALAGKTGTASASESGSKVLNFDDI